MFGTARVEITNGKVIAYIDGDQVIEAAGYEFSKWYPEMQAIIAEVKDKPHGRLAEEYLQEWSLRRMSRVMSRNYVLTCAAYIIINAAKAHARKNSREISQTDYNAANRVSEGDEQDMYGYNDALDAFEGARGLSASAEDQYFGDIAEGDSAERWEFERATVAQFQADCIDRASKATGPAATMSVMAKYGALTLDYADGVIKTRVTGMTEPEFCEAYGKSRGVTQRHRVSYAIEAMSVLFSYRCTHRGMTDAEKREFVAAIMRLEKTAKS